MIAFNPGICQGFVEKRRFSVMAGLDPAIHAADGEAFIRNNKK